MVEKKIIAGYERAKEVYAQHGIDVEKAIKKADQKSISMHCWQGDDLIGFDGSDTLTGGIQVTGNYPAEQEILKNCVMTWHLLWILFPGSKS